MNSSQENILAALYESAIAMTNQAANLLATGNLESAKALLSKRTLLLRDINRHIGRAPVWGKALVADQAALSYIRADRDLERIIDATCAK